MNNIPEKHPFAQTSQEQAFPIDDATINHMSGVLFLKLPDPLPSLLQAKWNRDIRQANISSDLKADLQETPGVSSVVLELIKGLPPATSDAIHAGDTFRDVTSVLRDPSIPIIQRLRFISNVVGVELKLHRAEITALIEEMISDHPILTKIGARSLTHNPAHNQTREIWLKAMKALDEDFPHKMEAITRVTREQAAKIETKKILPDTLSIIGAIGIISTLVANLTIPDLMNDHSQFADNIALYTIINAVVGGGSALYANRLNTAISNLRSWTMRAEQALQNNDMLK